MEFTGSSVSLILRSGPLLITSTHILADLKGVTLTLSHDRFMFTPLLRWWEFLLKYTFSKWYYLLVIYHFNIQITSMWILAIKEVWQWDPWAKECVTTYMSMVYKCQRHIFFRYKYLISIERKGYFTRLETHFYLLYKLLYIADFKHHNTSLKWLIKNTK